MIRRIRKFILWAFALVALYFAVSLTLIAYPQPLFAHAMTEGSLTVRSTTPQPEAARAVLRQIAAQLDASILPPEDPLTIYITGEGWRQDLYFAIAPYAGGLTFAGIAPRHMFLSGADIAADRLLKDGAVIAPPRTLSFYVLHEANHLALADRMGMVAFHRLPLWVREGLADHAALPVPDFDALADALGEREITLQDRQNFSSYPRKRLLVAWALTEGGFTLDTLLATDWSEADARAAFRQARAGH